MFLLARARYEDGRGGWEQRSAYMVGSITRLGEQKDVLSTTGSSSEWYATNKSGKLDDRVQLHSWTV